jgi:multiple sugar transport system substrate-binding protein
MVNVKTVTIAALAALLMSGLAGCSGRQEASGGPSGDNSSAAPPAMDTTPVKLKAGCVGACIDLDLFTKNIAEPLNKKYPFLTIELVSDKLEAWVSSGMVPDIIFSGILDVNVFKDNDMHYDLTPLIKKYKVDINQFDSASIDMVKKYGEKGEIYSLPYSYLFFSLFYNKDIFDRFGVPYPKDNMTWQEATDLARKLTRQTDGVQYRGLSVMAFPRLSLTMLREKYNEKAGKAVFTTDEWKEALEAYKNILTIPGNEKNAAAKEFFDKRDVAMFAGSPNFPEWERLHKEGNPLNWDMVSFPTFPGKKDQVDTPLTLMSITKQSQHKDQAFQAILLATSKETQMEFSKQAKVTILKDDAIKKAFGQDYATVKGKNTSAIWKNKNVPFNVSTPYDGPMNKELGAAADSVLKNGVDVNTALRTAEEKANAAIQTLKK